MFADDGGSFVMSHSLWCSAAFTEGPPEPPKKADSLQLKARIIALEADSKLSHSVSTGHLNIM